MLIKMIEMIGRVRRAMKGEEGASSLETGVVVGAAIVVATSMASGIGGSGVSASKASQQQVNKGMAKAGGIILPSSGADLYTSEFVPTVADKKVHTKEREETLVVGQSVRLVDRIVFTIRNGGSSDIDLSTLTVVYKDKFQRVRLNNPDADWVVSADGLSLSNGSVTLTYVQGEPFDVAGADNSPPTLKDDDQIEVSLSIANLDVRLAGKATFSVDMNTDDSQPLSMTITTAPTLKKVTKAGPR